MQDILEDVITMLEQADIWINTTPEWGCWFCFRNEKDSMTNLLKFWWRHQHTSGWGLSDSNFQLACPCNSQQNTTEKKHFGSKKLLRIPVFTSHSFRIMELNYALNLEQFKRYTENVSENYTWTNWDCPPASGSAELRSIKTYCCSSLIYLH